MFGTGKLKQEIAELRQRQQDQEAAFAKERAGLQQENETLLQDSSVRLKIEENQLAG